jgi:hypothetical protein
VLRGVIKTTLSAAFVRQGLILARSRQMMDQATNPDGSSADADAARMSTAVTGVDFSW